MTAMTVPPPGWAPIGARELQRSTRSRLGRALAVSALGHLTLLALLLFLQARHPEEAVLVFRDPVRLLPPPPIDTPLPPPSFPSPPAVTTDGRGTIRPVPNVDPRIDPGRILLPPVTNFPENGRERGPGANAGPGHPAITTETPPGLSREPGESESVPHDEEPVPIFHPDPDYPGWAREEGVQGTVQLHVLVGADGLVKKVILKKDVIGLGEAAQAGIARWTFRPARFHGHPVAVWVLIPVRFLLP